MAVTMLSSFYSAEGIVFAADTQITVTLRGKSEAREPQKKVLRVPGVGVGDGLLGYFGLAQVAGAPMTVWLRALLGSWPGGSTTDLGDFIVAGLRQDSTSAERKETSGFHLGAFERRAGQIAPVFVYARNVDQHPTTGRYIHIGDYRVDDQLPGYYFKDVPLRELRSELRKWANTTGLPYWLRNGDLDFFAPVWNGLGDGALLISRQPGYSAPNTLDSWETFARTLIVTTSNLYKILYTRGAPLIGNQPTVLSLPWP